MQRNSINTYKPVKDFPPMSRHFRVVTPKHRQRVIQFHSKPSREHIYITITVILAGLFLCFAYEIGKPSTPWIFDTPYAQSRIVHHNPLGDDTRP